MSHFNFNLCAKFFHDLMGGDPETWHECDDQHLRHIGRFAKLIPGKNKFIWRLRDQNAGEQVYMDWLNEHHYSKDEWQDRLALFIDDFYRNHYLPFISTESGLKDVMYEMKVECVAA